MKKYFPVSEAFCFVNCIKSIVFCLALLVFSISLFSQEITGTEYSKEYYQHKRKAQNITGCILAGGGLCMIVAGAVTYDQSYLFSWGTEPGPNNSLSNGLMLAGLGAIVVSIPFFLSAHYNKKMATSVTFKNQNVILPAGKGFATKRHPSVSLTIRI